MAVRRAPAVTGLVWLVVVAVAAITGNRFDATSFKNLWQLVPFENLRADPLGSVWNLHIQPPLWNLTVGVVARWTPFPEGVSFQVLMAAFGFVATVLLCDTLRVVGLRTRWAVALTLFVMCAPDVLVNAFEPRYELAVTAGLVAVVWIVARGSRQADRHRWLVALSVTATAVAMTRSIYHPIWLAALVGFFAWRWRAHVDVRWIAASLAVPLVVVGGWMLKNQYLVGRFTLDTWSGMNLERAVIPLVHADDKQQMLASGELSKVSAVAPFASYDYYVAAVGPCVRHWGSPVLDRLARDGPYTVPNFNAGCYLPVYDLARDDAVAAVRAHPDAYVEGRLWSARRWFAVDETFRTSNSAPLRALQVVYRVADVAVPGTIVVSNWGTPIFGTGDVTNHFSLLAVVCSVAVVVAALRRRRPHRDLDLCVGFVTVWTFAFGVLFELGEQPRFRGAIDPIVIAFGIVAVTGWFRPIVARRIMRGAREATVTRRASAPRSA